MGGWRRGGREFVYRGSPRSSNHKFGHEPCSHGCGKLFTHLGNRLVHERKFHPAEGRDAPLARTKASAGSAALRKAALQISKIEYANILSKNAPHLKELRLNMTDLMHVQGSAYQSLPAPVAMLTDAAFAMIFKAAHENLDSDLPGVFLAAFPRYVMAPPDGSDPTGQFPLTIKDRMTRLSKGEGQALWHEFKWIDHMPTIQRIKSVTPEMIKTVVARGLASIAPARTFRKLSAVPHLPPTDNVAHAY